jgi:serine protease Do
MKSIPGIFLLLQPRARRRLLGGAVLLMVWLSTSAFADGLPDFESLVKNQGKAVVKIAVTTERKLTSAQPEFDSQQMPEFFRRYFENMPQQPSPRRGGGFGSGFIMSEDGFIVTNAHVVQDAAEITVSLPDRREYEATLIGSDVRTDLALLKVEASGLPVVELGDSDELNVGEWVLAIGSPFGFEYTATQGIVSALSRSLPDGNYVPFIQTDVAVNPGNSGGPLFDLEGKVVGVNSQIYSRSGGYMGLSFAIPVNVVKTVTEQLKDTGFVSRGWLGVSIQNLDKSLAESFGLDRPEGALVASVTPDSPADKAGLKTGDVILSFGGDSIGQSSNLPPLVGATPVGEPVGVDILRNRERQTVSVVIAELAEDREVVRTSGTQDKDDARLGVSVSDLSVDQLAEYGDIKSGVLVNEVDPDGVAAVAGIAAGDVIVSFNQTPISSAKVLAKAVKEAPAGETVAVLVQRNQNALFTALTMPE